MASVRQRETEWGELNGGLATQEQETPHKTYYFDRFGLDEILGFSSSEMGGGEVEMMFSQACPRSSTSVSVCVPLICAHAICAHAAVNVGYTCYLCVSLFPPTYIQQLADRQMDVQQSQHPSSISGANKLQCRQYEKQVATFCSRAERDSCWTHRKCLQRKIKST